MKFALSNSRQGNGLIVALMLTAVIGIDLASYLSLVRAQNRSNMRSMMWNRAIPVAESGVEETIAHLLRNGSNFNHATYSLANDGWILSGGRYYLSRTNGDTRYSARISSLTSNSANIRSTGYVSLASMQLPGTWIERAVLVRMTNAALWAKSLVARTDIDLKGNNMYSDSYDSTLTNASTGGLYDPAKRRAFGDVASNSGLTNSISVGNADIYGRVSTGPGGSVAIGANGFVGDIAWNSNPANRGLIKPGYYTDDMNVSFPPVDPPYSTGTGMISGTYGSPATNYTVLIDSSGKYYGTSLHLSGTQTMLITAPNVTIYFTGDFRMTGNAEVILAPGASVKFYAGGDYDLQGRGVFNQSGLPINMQFYGLPSCDNFTLGGNGILSAAVYAPSAFFQGVGNGEVYGAVVCAQAELTGNMNFHYDEALGKTGPKKGMVPSQWAEY